MIVKRQPGVRLAKWILVAMVGALLFRTFGYEAFSIPSGSMMPTLLAGDTVLVSKLSYGLSRYSLPIWHPGFEGRLFAQLPSRGDVAVFKLPRSPKEDYIKRIVGLPGDRIQMVGGKLFINGLVAPEERVGDFVDPADPSLPRLPQLVETLPGGRTHTLLKQKDHSALDDTEAWIVPPGYVFAMGDNRDASEDSRVMDEVGFIPVENLVGRAEIRLFSLGGRVQWWELWRWPQALRLDRMWTAVQ